MRPKARRTAHPSSWRNQQRPQKSAATNTHDRTTWHWIYKITRLDVAAVRELREPRRRWARYIFLPVERGGRRRILDEVRDRCLKGTGPSYFRGRCS
jgi:hypothetical protein